TPTVCLPSSEFATEGGFVRHRWWLTAAAITPLVASALAGFGPAAQASGALASGAQAARQAPSDTGPGLGNGRTGLQAGNPFCKRLGKVYQASSGAQMFCFGAQKAVQTEPAAVGPASSTLRNVNAASFKEDVSPAGVRGYGQSEESVAASGRYV